jgi:hypothetical protein
MLGLSLNFTRKVRPGEKLTTSLINQVLTSVSAAISGVVANNELSPSAVKNNVTVPDDFWYAAGALAGDTYDATYNAGLTAWKTGLVLCFKADTANAGACKLNFGAGAKWIKKHNGEDLAAGDIPAGAIVEVRYDGTDCQITSGHGVPVPQPVIASARNLTYKSVAPVLQAVQVTADEMVVKNASGRALLLSAVNVTATLNGASTGSGFLDTGVEAHNTWYRFWVIHNPTTGINSAVWSTATTLGALTLPAGYTYAAMVGASRNSGADLIYTHGVDRRFSHTVQSAYSGAGNGAVVGQALDISAYVPPEAKVVYGVIGSTSANPLRAEISGQAGPLLGAQYLTAGNSATAGADTVSTASVPFRVTMWDAQTIYWRTPGVTNHVIYITGYEI